MGVVMMLWDSSAWGTPGRFYRTDILEERMKGTGVGCHCLLRDAGC